MRFAHMGQRACYLLWPHNAHMGNLPIFQ